MPGSSSKTGENAGGASRSTPKQAVVVIHGMGEQRPMSTMRGFVEAVWTSDPALNPRYAPGQPNKSWVTPDDHTGSHELRRITTPYLRDEKNRPLWRTDFYELYWADLTQDTTRGRIFFWVKELLWRRRSDIPADAVRLYRATWAFALVTLVSMAVLAASQIWDFLSPGCAFALLAFASAVLWVLDHFVIPYFGDVAAYVRATPGTVRNRAEVRERGLALLRALSDDDDYDRIVVVGHSLGSMIAYDLLHILWAERRPRGLDRRRDKATTDAVKAVEAFAALPDAAPAQFDAERRAAFRAAQWRLYLRLRARGAQDRSLPWKISDLVTVGSPLTHAEFLVTKNAGRFRDGVGERLFGICPPLSDSASAPKLLYDEAGRGAALHHGAVFAATRWTNIYDLGNLLWTGDPFSGSMAENFGVGVEEFRVAMRRRRWGRLFTHSLYWRQDVSSAGAGDEGTDAVPAHIRTLRRAVDIRRKAGDPEREPENRNAKDR